MNILELRSKTLSSTYLLVRFLPGGVVKKTTNSLEDLRKKNLKVTDNILIYLPTVMLVKWLSCDRIGSFQLENGKIHFVPGIPNINLYQPIQGSLPIFSLCRILHDLWKINFYECACLFMKFRTDYIQLRVGNPTKVTLFYENTNEINDVNLCIRLSRKRTRRSR